MVWNKFDPQHSFAGHRGCHRCSFVLGKLWSVAEALSSDDFLHIAQDCCTAQVRVEIESLAEGVDLSEPLTRARFEELIGDLLKKTLSPVKKVRMGLLVPQQGKTAFLCNALSIIGTLHYSHTAHQ